MANTIQYDTTLLLHYELNWFTNQIDKVWKLNKIRLKGKYFSTDTKTKGMHKIVLVGIKFMSRTMKLE